jgi:hypothetical protein
MNHQPPVYQPITPITISERWFPRGQSFGLYESGGRVAPNVTSILGWKFPFDKKAWVEKEPDIDHDAVTKESAERGTAVHAAMENWLMGAGADYPEHLAPWVEPLRALVGKGTATLGVEIPVHHSILGVGRYAGSCDGLMLVGNEVVIIDYKTKRFGKKVHARFLDKQRLQLAAYSIALSSQYADQLPAPVTRTSLLFAHPDRPQPTVVSTAGDELKRYQQQWTQLLADWYAEHGEAVEAEQKRFELRRRAAA